MYVLDTNTLIYYFKNEGRVAERLLQTAPDRIAIPVIVIFELKYGIAKSSAPEKRQSQLEAFLGVVKSLPFGNPEADLAAGIRAELESKGTPIGPYDVLIAATAMANDGILVTRNLREFSRIASLRVENWYE